MDHQNHTIELRVLTLDDHEALLDLQRRCFGDMEATTLEMFESQLFEFQEGQMGIFF